MQWQANGNAPFTLDYFGPEYFGGAQPTCSDFPAHNNIHVASSDAVVIEGLQPSTSLTPVQRGLKARRPAQEP